MSNQINHNRSNNKNQQQESNSRDLPPGTNFRTNTNNHNRPLTRVPRDVEPRGIAPDNAPHAAQRRNRARTRADQRRRRERSAQRAAQRSEAPHHTPYPLASPTTPRQDARLHRATRAAVRRHRPETERCEWSQPVAGSRARAGPPYGPERCTAAIKHMKRHGIFGPGGISPLDDPENQIDPQGDASVATKKRRTKMGESYGDGNRYISGEYGQFIEH